MAEHFIIVTPDEEHLRRLAEFRPVTDEDRSDAFKWRVECSDPGRCPGWIECREDHDSYDTDGEAEMHGVTHEWLGFWAVPFDGCPVMDTDVDAPEGLPLDRPGRYLVDAEWDDDHCYLELHDEADR